MSRFTRAFDRAVAEENARAVADGYAPAITVLPEYPEGTPEYSAYVARLRAALADLRD